MRVSAETVKRKHRNRFITTLVMVAAFCVVFQPVIPQCSVIPEPMAMMAAGDCAMDDSAGATAADDSSNACHECPVAFCFSSASSAQLNASALSDTNAFRITSQVTASETVLTGRTLTPPGHPPKV